MEGKRLRVLFISDLFPNSVWPAHGIFVERQASHLLPHCDVDVIVPTRVFPPLRLWKKSLQARLFLEEWRRWTSELEGIPASAIINDMPVYYPRYTSPPRQLSHGLWGHFAYPFVKQQIRALHAKRRYDLIHAHYASPGAVIALLARRWMHVPVVVSVHGADVTYTAVQNRIGTAVVQDVFRRVDAIIANSAWTAQRIRHFGGAPSKTVIVRLGANPPLEMACQKEHGDAQTTNLLTVGYLEDRKGQAIVLKAMRLLLDEGYRLRYTLVGNGSRTEHLRSLAAELGLADVVSFEGYKAHSEVWRHFRDCDIFVLPSWNEAFGVVYIEALSFGKPVIGCEGEGGPEDLKALGDCIELVKPRDVLGLATAIKRLIDQPERRERMGQIGRGIVKQQFSWQQNATATMSVYQEVLRTYHA